MKKIFLLTLFFINVLSFSQQAVITDIDGNPIKITPIDPDPIDPIDPIDPSPTVPFFPGYHDTQGKFEVSNNGQATYTLPIALPPSIQSVGPTINLVYSSGQMGGIAGQGWNINSISTIARIATRKDIDGFVDGVDFDDNDKLALDGQRLILVSGNYWADGSVYKTEVLSNSKIELKGSGTSIYFIVTAPDGSRSWYGNFGGQNATDLTAFYIVRFEDTNGNFITYHYNKPLGKALCINEIKFSANTNGLTTPLNSIKFNYAEAKRAENAYIKGVKHEKVELLKTIFVYTNNQIFRKYVLSHDVDPQLAYERVVQLQEFNSNDEAANPVVFEYPTTTMDRANSETLTSYTNNLNFNDVELSGDFDGDGRLDFVTENGLYRNLFQGNSGQAPISLNISEKKKLIATTLTSNKLNQFQSIIAVDSTASQLEFKVYNLLNNAIQLSYSKIIGIDNTGTFTNQNYCTLNETSYIKKSNKYYSGDFNGDGISEVLLSSTINENTHKALTLDEDCVNCKFSIDFTNNRLFNFNSSFLNSPPTYSTKYKVKLNGTNKIVGTILVEVDRNSFNNTIEYRFSYYDNRFKFEDLSTNIYVNMNKDMFYNYRSLPQSNFYFSSIFFPASIICFDKIEDEGRKLHLIDLNQSSSTSLNSAGFIELTNSFGLTSSENILIQDFNGDGKDDILTIEDSGSYKIFTINQLDAFPFSQLDNIGQGTIDKYSKTKQLLLGDFNGDGKTDIMLPDTEGGSGHTLWHIYYANPNPAGGSFFVKESHNIVEYRPNTGIPGTSGADYDTQVHYSTYYAIDTNGDGKSDVVRIWRRHYKVQGLFAWNDHDTEWNVTSYVNNIGNTQFPSTNKFQLDYQSPCQIIQGPMGAYNNCNHTSDSPGLIIPVVSGYKYSGIKQDLVIVHNHYNRVFYIKFKKDVSEDIRVKKISSSGGNIVDEVQYATMEPSTNLNNGQGALNEFYSSNNSVNYPNVEIKKLPSYYLVSKLTNTTEGITKHQDFRYHGLVANLNGLGTIGFNKTARSAWYQNASSKRLWNVYENNPNWRGALSRSYSQLITVGNLFSFVNSGNPSGIVNSTSNLFQSYVSNGSYFLFLSNQYVRDFITNVTTETAYEYDYTYLLPTSITTRNYNGTTSLINPVGVKVTNTTFENNPNGTGADYHIGRPLEINSTTTAYGGTSTSKEIFTYSGNKLIKTQKRGNTTDSKFLIEEFIYNPVGNVIKKTLSSSGYSPTETFTPRITEYTYDTTERFVKTSKDIEGLIATNVSYHPLYGIVTETLSPFGLTSKVYVDHWGKVYKTTDYLNNNTTITYSKSSNEYTTTKVGDDGSSSIIISDALGRSKKSGQKNIDGTWSYKIVEYDYLGRKFRESEPFSSSPSLWTTYTYDDYSRLIQQTFPTGVITYLNYSNNTVSGTTDYSDGNSPKFTSSTKNANGHVISSSDNGGAITYEYYADGNLKKSTYSGSSVIMEYDEWGRKKKLNDPSAGEYTYTYNAIGELLTETTPNGTTTNTYDDFGNIDESTIVGTNTNSKTEYTYDNTTKLLTNLKYTDFNNGGAYDEYTYSYDSYKRLLATEENKFGSFYQRVTLYDAFGRPEKESYNAIAAGKQSTKWIKNTYKNGYHWQIFDDATNAILWQSNAVNARGQLTSANYGNGIALNNSYDAYGYITQSINFNAVNTSNVLMTLNNTFEPKRGNLTSRHNSLFNWTENFQYDSVDRLTHYTNAQGQQVQQIYEADGRIKENNLGKYNYNNQDNPQKKYQNTSIDLNPDSKAYYENRLGIFNDGMETKQGWTSYEPLVFSFDETVKRSGNVSFKITNTTTTEKVVNSDVWTKIDNAVPTEYTYSAWVKSDGSNPEAEIFLYMKTENETGYFTQVDQKVTATSNDWILIEKTFLVPANIKKLNIRLDNNGTGNLWFDDVRIRKTSDADNGERKLNISYNTWKSPYQIEETNVDKISFTYNYMNNRSSMFYGGLQTDKYQRQFHKSYSADGTMEVKINNATNEVEFITYIGGDAYSAPIVLKSDGNTQNYLYLHRDYQGSIIAITNQTGDIVEKRLYDAWGEVIKVQDGQGNVLNGFKVLDRGYTGHEHLHSVGLIHMNGRLYDSKLHRFLQPDNYIQDPYNTQNYNRYAYVLNNPLKYTDPSGEVIQLGAAIAIGAFIAATTYTIQASYTYGFHANGWGLFKATFFGAASAAATFGIGNITQALPLTTKIVAQAFLHGTSQAFFTGIQGGDPLVGFASGSLSSVASSAWSIGAGKFAESGVGMVTFGTVAGGAGAALTGGNFWQGAVTGLVVSGLNHFAHLMNKPKTTVAGIYGAGSEEGSGNPDLRELVEGKGGKMFSSTTPFGEGDDEIIAYLKAGFEKGNQLEIYGHSRGGAAAVRIANKLGAMNIHVNQITLFDPVSLGGNFVFTYPNVMRVTNYYQRNSTVKMAGGVPYWNLDNPFIGSPVSGNFQWPVINNVNLTGVPYKPGVSMSHLNITRYAIKHF